MSYGTSGHNVGAGGLPYRTSTSAMTSNTNPPGKLWLPIWSGEVIHAYDEYNKFEGMIDSRTISSGTTMEFPVTGTVSLKTAWEAGEELIGGHNATATTFQVKLDKRPIAAHFELDNIDLMLTQWEYRAELARQAGMTLANARDKQIAAYIARAGCEDALTNDPRSLTPKAPFASDTYAHLGDAGGDTSETDAALLLLKNIEDFMVYLQENNIATEGVYCAVTPAAFQSIRSLGVARDYLDLGYGNVVTGGSAGDWAVNGPTAKMFGGDYDGLGSSLAGRPQLSEMMTYMGCTICKSNHTGVGTAYNETAANIGEDRYNLDFLGGNGGSVHHAALKSFMWQRGAVASLSLQGVKVDTVDDIRRNTTFTVASRMSGTGVLRPELACCVVDTTGVGGVACATRADLQTAFAMTGGAAVEYVDA